MKMDLYSQVVDYITSNQEKFYRLAYSYVHSKEAALDIVQNSIIKALENYESIRHREFIKTWFYRIVVNESLTYIKKNQKELLDDYKSAKEEVYYESELEGDEALYKCIDSLGEPMKTVIMLHFYEDLTLKQIAETTEVNLSTVKYRLYAALKHIKKNYKGGI